MTKKKAELIAANNSGPVSVGCPGDRGCVDCGKVINPEAVDSTTYLLDARGRYWCLEHVVDALSSIRRRHDERDQHADLYKWSF